MTKTEWIMNIIGSITNSENIYSDEWDNYKEIRLRLGDDNETPIHLREEKKIWSIRINYKEDTTFPKANIKQLYKEAENRREELIKAELREFYTNQGITEL